VSSAREMIDKLSSVETWIHTVLADRDRAEAENAALKKKLDQFRSQLTVQETRTAEWHQPCEKAEAASLRLREALTPYIRHNSECPAAYRIALSAEERQAGWKVEEKSCTCGLAAVLAGRETTNS
jgi:hypothetical protein